MTWAATLTTVMERVSGGRCHVQEMLGLLTRPRASSGRALLVSMVFCTCRPVLRQDGGSLSVFPKPPPPRVAPPWPTAGPSFSSDAAGDGPIDTRWLREEFNPHRHSPFEVLGLPPMSLTSFLGLPVPQRRAMVRAAFFWESRTYHPDEHPAVPGTEASMQAARDACAALLDPSLGPVLAMQWLPRSLSDEAPLQTFGDESFCVDVLRRALSLSLLAVGAPPWRVLPSPAAVAPSSPGLRRRTASESSTGPSVQTQRDQPALGQEVTAEGRRNVVRSPSLSSSGSAPPTLAESFRRRRSCSRSPAAERGARTHRRRVRRRVAEPPERSLHFGLED